MRPKDAHEAIVAIVDTVPDDEQSQLFRLLRERYPEYIGRVSLLDPLPQDVSTPVAPEVSTDETSESFQDDVILEELTPEQREKAAKLTAAMAEKFNVEPSDFAVFATVVDEKPQYTVAYAATKSLYKGKPNKILGRENDGLYIVEIDGQKYDTRRGMTEAVWRAIDCRAEEKGLPRLDYLTKYDYKNWTATLLTGEPADGLEPEHIAIDPPTSNMYNKTKIEKRRYSPKYRGNVRSCFRPAVILE